MKTPTKAYKETVEILDADQDGAVSVSDFVASAQTAASAVVDVLQTFNIKELAIGAIEAKATQVGELIGEEPQESADKDDAAADAQGEGCKSWVGQSVEEALKTVPQTVKVLNALRTKAKRFSSDHKVMRLDLFDVVEQAITTAIVQADTLAVDGPEMLTEKWNTALLSAQQKVGELRDAVTTLLTLPISGERKDELIKASSAWVSAVGEDAWAPINDCTEYIASYKDRMNLEGAKSFVSDTKEFAAHATGYSRNEERYGKLDQQLKKLLQSIFNIRLIFVSGGEDDDG